MTPYEYVADALTRLTDGTITFMMEEDAYTVGAGFQLSDGLYAHAWAKWKLSEPERPEDRRAYAEQGVRDLLAKANAPVGGSS